MNSLNYKSYRHKTLEVNRHQLDRLIYKLDQKHRLERKVKFLLDIRGYLSLNSINGDYVEFGLYQGEMLYSAHKILEDRNVITKYIGLDTFDGEPPEETGDIHIDAHKEGEYDCCYDDVNTFLTTHIDSNKLQLLKGDFRNETILDEINSPIALAVIDANLWSSNKTALDKCLEHMVSGGVIFIDDYYDNLVNGVPIVEEYIKNNGRFLEFNVYPPFAKAFIIGDVK